MHGSCNDNNSGTGKEREHTNDMDSEKRVSIAEHQ